MLTITTTEHMLAKAASDVVATAKFLTHTVLPVLQKAQANEATVEAVTGLVSPQAVNIERVAFGVLGLVCKAIEDSSTAAGAAGLNVSLDAALVADLKGIMPALRAAAPKVA